MKYKIPLTKTESRDVEIFAEDHSSALAAAMQHNPGFRGSVVVRLGENDEGEAEYERMGQCENCNKEFWSRHEAESYHEDPYVWTEDDCMLCPECAKACQEAQAASQAPNP